MPRKLILTIAAATLVAAPVAAQAAPTAAPARDSSPVAETEGISQGLLALLLASGFALLVLIFSGNDSPSSP